MRVLSLTQPWASLVCLGAKRYETRSWQSWYTGPLLIHASKAYPRWAKELEKYDPYYSALRAHGVYDPSLSCGQIIGCCDLKRCFRTEDVRDSLDDKELAFGDYSDDRFAWKLDNGSFLPKPIPAKGALGLWEFDLHEYYSVLASELAR
jgi:hypothetical protein